MSRLTVALGSARDDETETAVECEVLTGLLTVRKNASWLLKHKYVAIIRSFVEFLSCWILLQMPLSNVLLRIGSKNATQTEICLLDMNQRDR